MFKKNTAVTGFGIGHFINASTGATVTTGTPTCKRTLDGTGGACANAASYNTDGAVWEIDLAAGDLNADVVILSFTLTDCLPIAYTIRTTTGIPDASGYFPADAVALSGDTTAANNAESFFDGTGYAGTNNVIPTVTTVTTTTNLTNERGKYANGSVWIGPTANTNTVSYTDGIITNPVSTIAAAKTIMDALGMRRAEVIRTGAVQIGAALAGYRISGVGWSCTTTGGSQDVGTTAIIGANVIGGTYASTTGTINWQDCEFATGVTVGVSNMVGCRFQGTLTLNAAGNYDFVDCCSVVAGTGTPEFAIPSGTVNVSFRRWSGGIRITGITSGTTVSIDCVSGGTVTLEGADGNVQVRGMVAAITDGRTGTPTLGQNAAINITKINTECDTALTDYDPPTNTEMEARTLVAAAYATAANQATIAGYLDTEIAAILQDTDELQKDWVNGGRLDLLIDAIKGKTDYMLDATAVENAVWNASQASHTSAGTFGLYVDAKISEAGGGGLTAEAVADAVWDEVATGHIDTGKAGAQLWTVINTLTSGSAINVTSTNTVIESE